MYINTAPGAKIQYINGSNMKKFTIIIILIFLSLAAFSQLNIKHYLGAGRYAIFKKDYTEAIYRFSRIIEVKPNYAEAYFLRGIAKYSLGDYMGAREDLTQAIQINPFYATAYHYRGLTKEQLNDFHDAIADFEQALQMDPTEPMVYVHRGLTYLMNDKFEMARNDFNEALRLDANMPEAYMNRAITHLELNDTAQAISDLNRSIKLNPFNSESFRRRGLVSYLTKNYEQAITDYNQALRLDKQNSLIVYQRALAHYKNGNYQAALDDYNTVITLDSDNALALYNRALLKSEIGEYGSAIEDYNEVTELNPDNVLVYYNRAGVKIEIEDYAGALKDYDKAIGIFPDFATAYINRSIVKQKLGKEKEAYLDRQKAEQIIAEYKKTYSDTTYEIFKDTSRNLRQLVDFNSEFNNSFSRTSLQNKNVQITLKNNFIILPAQESTTPERGLFVNALFEYEKKSESRKWIPQLWSTDNTHLDIMHESIDSVTRNSNDWELYNYAIVQSMKNNFRKGLQAFDGRSDNWQSYFIKGTIKAQMAEYLQSMNDYPTEIRINSDGQPIGAKASGTPTIDYSDAIEDLTHSVELNKEFSLAYYNRGNLYCQQRDFKKGINDYTEALSIDEIPEAYFNRGLTLIYLKENEKGCLDISKAGELGIEEAYNVIKRFCSKE
jgi:tetratricopeptide (TPR) repeat protein